MEKLQACTRCQQCNTKLSISGLEASSSSSSLKDAPSGKASVLRSAMRQSVVGGQKIDESFIVLDPSKQLRSHQPGNLDESYLLVAGSASLLRQGGQQPLHGSSQGVPLHNVDDLFQQLGKILDMASGQTEIDQPLCQDCASKVREEVEKTVASLDAECAAYEAAIKELQSEALTPRSEKEFEEELRAAEAELRDETAKAKQAEHELEEAQAELAAARDHAVHLEALEEEYHHTLNDHALKQRHRERQKLTLDRKIWRSEEQLRMLQATNVYNSVFNIWHDGPFGTISGFRLGRTSACPVEWDEINAAWGQAVLLLHTMAQACKLTFSSYRLMPMGSFSRIADNKKGVMDLYGPVNRLICASYDRAMVSYLTCLKEFYEFAQGRDRAGGRTPLEMVYAIEGDLVGGQTIKLMMNKDSKWTLALKYMLANLKWALAWMTATQNGQVLVRKEDAPGSAPREQS